MLRTVRTSHIGPRLLGFSVTSNGTTPTKSTGGYDLETVTGVAGQVTCPFARDFGRAPVIVGTKSTADVAANGSAFLVSAATNLQGVVGTHSGGAGAADNGTGFYLCLGHDSADATKYRPSGFPVKMAWDRPGVLGFRITTTSPTVDIGPRGTTLVKNGTGDVTITFPGAFGSSSIIPVATPILGTRAEISATVVGPSSVRVVRTVSGSGTDGAFYLIVLGSYGSATYQWKKNELENNQRLPRLLGYRVIWTAGTPSLAVGTGDATIADTGTGDVALTFTTPFKREPIVVATPISAALATVKANATTSGVSITAFAAGGSATDITGVDILTLGWDDATVY